MYIYIYRYTYICTYVCEVVRSCFFAYASLLIVQHCHACVGKCVYVYIYIYIYVHTHIHTSTYIRVRSWPCTFARFAAHGVLGPRKYAVPLAKVASAPYSGVWGSNIGVWRSENGDPRSEIGWRRSEIWDWRSEIWVRRSENRARWGASAPH